MKEIQLSRGKIALVDDSDFDFLNQYQWSYTKNGTGEYAKMCAWDSEHKKHINVYMHKLILNTPKGMCVDHIDHNGLNNQRSNLRVCTYSANQRNRINNGKKKKTSKYWGVSVRPDGLITAYCHERGKTRSLGCFKTEEDAARARDNAVAKFASEYAVFNFPDEIKNRKENEQC